MPPAPSADLISYGPSRVPGPSMLPGEPTVRTIARGLAVSSRRHLRELIVGVSPRVRHGLAKAAEFVHGDHPAPAEQREIARHGDSEQHGVLRWTAAQEAEQQAWQKKSRGLDRGARRVRDDVVRAP